MRTPATPRPPVLLELDLSRGLVEAPPSDPAQALRTRGLPTLRGLVERLRRAAADPHVVGLVGHLGTETLTPSQADELGAAVEAFGRAGRVTVAYAESFGELGGASASYRLAVAFDTIWMQPTGRLGLTGVSLRGVYLRGLLDRLGVQPQLGQRHEYKGAADTFMSETMPPAQREALQRVADSVLETMVRQTARRRRLTEDDVRTAVDEAPLSAAQSVRLGLVDRLGYRDEVYADLRDRLADDGRITLRYVHRWTPPLTSLVAARARDRGQPTVAVVPVVGGIVPGRSHGTPLGGPMAGSDTVTAALRAASRRPEVRAVVLRVVSPGGSYIASDAVRREVLQLRASGRPVVASMGSVAASGGYFVAMGCDEVVATDSTITGSIGVVAGKLAVGDALGRAGIGVSVVGAGRQATMFGSDAPFDAEQWERLNAWLDEVYADFTGKAAHDRGMPVDRLEPLARGRIWTGADAIGSGLVDTIGGLRAAIGRAAERAGLHADEVRPRTVPQVGPLQRFRPASSSEAPAAALPLGAAAMLTAPVGSRGLSGLEAVLARAGVAPAGVVALPGHWDLS